MKLPTIVTSCLLLLIVLFPCSEVFVRTGNNLDPLVKQRHWGFLFETNPPPNSKFHPAQMSMDMEIMAVEAFGAVVVGLLIWVIGRPAKARDGARESAVSSPRTPAEPLP